MPIDLGGIYSAANYYSAGRFAKRARRREARAILAAARRTNDQLLQESDRLRSTQRARAGAAGVDLGSILSVDQETRASLFLEQQRVLRGAGISANSLFAQGRSEQQQLKKQGNAQLAGAYGSLF